MRLFSKMALGAVGALALTGSAIATDFGLPTPDEVMTDWSGVYAGVMGAYYTSSAVPEIAGVVGVNFLPAESFLLGVEGRLGYAFGPDDVVASVSARAGVVAGPAVIYAAVGGWYDVTSPAGVIPFAGGGVEFAAGDSASIRLQGVYYLTTSATEVSASLLWHFH